MRQWGPRSVSQADYARHRGCSPTAVRKAIKDGRIEPLPDGRIDPITADEQWERNTRRRSGQASAGVPPPPSVIDQHTVVDAVLAAVAQAHTSRVVAAFEAGRLVHVDDVRAALETHLAELIAPLREGRCPVS